MNGTKVRSPASLYSMMNRGESVNEKHLGIDLARKGAGVDGGYGPSLRARAHACSIQGIGCVTQFQIDQQQCFKSNSF